MLSTGHNNLYRTTAIQNVGGFDERFVAEDIALTLNLARAGYASRLVAIETYEAEPEHVFAYIARLLRWAKQTVQIHRADWTGVPFALKFQIFRNAWFYANFSLGFAWALLLTWVPEFLHSRQGHEIADPEAFAYHFTLVPLLSGLIIPIGFLILKMPFVLKAKVTLVDYFAGCVLLNAISLYAISAVVLAQLTAIVCPTVKFPVSEKGRRIVTLFGLIFGASWNWLFSIIVCLGVYYNNDILMALEVWSGLFLGLPILIYCFHSAKARRPFFVKEG
jgi:cellulose synthase/poly-beta-1,6-N-acetylglucosamine synthase-like glycosyltransferase